MPALLRQLELAGCIVTADALHCQKAVAREITEADADHVLALKGNHATVHGEVRAYLDDAITRQAPELAALTTVEKDHGRLETRRYRQSAALGGFADRAEWPGLRSIGVVEATRQIGDKVTMERRYHLSSLPLDAALFAQAVRGHWATREPVPLGPRRRLPRGPVPRTLRPRGRQPRPRSPPRPQPLPPRKDPRPRAPPQTAPCRP